MNQSILFCTKTSTERITQFIQYYMEKIDSNSFENHEQKGHNIILEIDLIRHAEKDGFNGRLTKEGKENAARYGRGLNAKVYHSQVPRAQETAQEIAKGSTYKPRLRPVLMTEISPEYLEKYAELTRANNGDESEGLQMYLDTGDVRPDATTLSSQEVSKRLVQTLLHFVRLSERVRDRSQVRIVLVSHSGTIEHLLVNLLETERKNFVSESGGALQFLEGAKFFIKRDEKGHLQLILQFRGREKEINLSDLEKL